MDAKTANESRPGDGTRRVVSMRLVLALTSAALVAVTVVGVGSVAERNLRNALHEEVRSRLMLEATNLAHVGSDALLDDFPELLLMPVVQEMQADRPELAYVAVTDHAGLIQGHADSRLLGQAFEIPDGLVPESLSPEAGEIMLASDDLIVASVIIRHGKERLGTAHVALYRSYLDAAVARARKALIGVSALMLLLATTAAAISMHVMLRPIAALRAGLERIGRGDMDTPMHLRDRTELGLLADTVNDMAGRIKESQGAMIEKERLDHEMDLAGRIQASLMPEADVNKGRFTAQGLFEAAAEVGGDFFDVFELPGDRLGLFVADVAGKGLGGCLVTSMLAALVRTHRDDVASPRDLLSRIDRDLSDFLEPGIFVTAFYGILDTMSGRFTFASAAHCPLLLASSTTGEVEEHRTEGVPLGIMPHDIASGSLHDHVILMNPGDMVLVYTDGLTEAVQPGGTEQFGVERVKSVMSDYLSCGAEAVLTFLKESVSAWEDGGIRGDDLTLLTLHFDGKVRAEDSKSESLGRRAGDLQSFEEIYDGAALSEFVADSRHLVLGPGPVEVTDLDRWFAECGGPVDPMLLIAIYEYVSNVQEHGYIPPRKGELDLWWGPSTETSSSEGVVLIRDRGRSCPPDSVAQPDLEDPAVRSRGRGFGWELIRRAVKDIHYRVIPMEGNLCLIRPLAERKTEEVVNV